MDWSGKYFNFVVWFYIIKRFENIIIMFFFKKFYYEEIKRRGSGEVIG